MLTIGAKNKNERRFFFGKIGFCKLAAVGYFMSKGINKGITIGKKNYRLQYINASGIKKWKRPAKEPGGKKQNLFYFG